MKNLLFICCLFTCLTASAQKNREWGAALTNSNTAMPFGKFSGLFSGPVHPGFELSYGFNWKTKKRHDWFQQFRVGYFNHRFVQHGIPVYATFGYRYKFSSRLFSEAGLGAGYLHSIPATARFKLNGAGEYENSKGAGRMQAMLVFNLSAGYTLNPTARKPMGVFAAYQQRIQTPFVKSYVPLLPYNSMMIGAKITIPKKK